jgi:hypothetical protein
MIYRINEAELEASRAKIIKINERAVKRGFTGSFNLTTNRAEVTKIDDFGFQRTEIWYDVELAGAPPCYAGWTFLAVLDWDDHAGLIVRAAPGTQQVDRSNIHGNFCSHCNTSRRRNQTYIVYNQETRQQVQVGSTCIKDFLGWNGSLVFMDMDSVASDLGFGFGSPGADSFGTLYVLAVAWALIKLDGYKPASSWGNSTKGDVMDVLCPPRTMDTQRHAELARIRELAEEAMSRASECLAWVRSDNFTGTGDYVTNLKNIAAADLVSLRNVGILASAPQAWARWQERTLVRNVNVSESAWIGAAGERITLTATINAIRFIDHEYGTTVLYSLQDAAGNVIKWFASREALGDQVGITVTLKATIKELDEYKGVKQTVITRAKALAA